MRFTSCIILVCLLSNSQATTWVDEKATDPISGNQVTVESIASYGSYIYSWPSKYDQVFWPLTAGQYYWFNPKTGFSALAPDFETLTKEEVACVREFLAENYDPSNPPATFEERVEWTFEIYKARKSDLDTQAQLCGVLAYHYRTDPKTAEKYQLRVLRYAEEQAKTLKPSFQLARLHYLQWFYNHLAGNSDQASQALRDFRALTWKATGEETTEKDTKNYFNELIQNVKTGAYKKEYLR